MSSKVAKDEPVLATEPTMTPGLSEEQCGANRQENGTMEYSQGAKDAVLVADIIPGGSSQTQDQQSDIFFMDRRVGTSPIASKPPAPVPSMARLNSQSSAIQSTSSITSSRRSTNYDTSVLSLTPSRPAPPSPVSQPASRRPSWRASRTLSTTSATNSARHSLSYKASAASMRKSVAKEPGDDEEGILHISMSRRQSSLAIAFTTSTTGMDGTGTTEMDGVGKVDGAVSTANADGANATPSQTAEVEAPISRNLSSVSTSTSGGSTTSSSSSSNPVLRHATELQEAYGILPSVGSMSRIARSNSGVSGAHTPLFLTRPRSSARSTRESGTRTMAESQDPETNKFSTAEAGDAGAGVDAEGQVDPPLSIPPELPNTPEAVSNLPPPKDASEVECGDPAWALQHIVVVCDFAFAEDDERFSRVPIEAVLSVLRPSMNASDDTERSAVTGSRASGRARPNGLPGRGRRRGGFRHYSGGWGDVAEDFEEDEFDDDYHGEKQGEEEDDGWGFPMGTVSGGPEPLGTTLLGGRSSRRGLKNRVRAWSGLGGSKGVGGRWVTEETSEAEGESSGFYEEPDHEEISGEEGEEGEEEEGELLATAGTPGKAYRAFASDEGPSTLTSTSIYIPGSQFIPLDHTVHSGQIEMDGMDADEDEDDLMDYEEEEEEVKPGLYRALFSFEAEGPLEMSLVEGQMVRVLGKSSEGWVIAERSSTNKTGGSDTGLGGLNEMHGLVPLGFLEVNLPDGEHSSHTL